MKEYKKKFVFLLAELLLLDWFLLFWVVSSDINSIVACMLSAWQCWLSSLQTTSLSKTDEGAKNLKYSSYLKHSVFPPRVILFCLLLGGKFFFFKLEIFSHAYKKNCIGYYFSSLWKPRYIDLLAVKFRNLYVRLHVGYKWEKHRLLSLWVLLCYPLAFTCVSFRIVAE